VMASLGKMAIGSWLRYTLGSFADCAGHSLSVVGYEDLLADPRGQLKAIVGRHPGWTPSPESWEGAVGSIQSDLRHNRSSIEDLASFPSIVFKTFDAARRFSDQDPNSWAEVIRLHREFETWTRILSDRAPLAGKLGLSWMVEGQRQIAEVQYMPSREWQTVRIVVDAPPKTPVSGLLYGLPFRAWIRRSVWHRGSGATPATPASGLGSVLNYANGVYRLDGVFEPNQIQFVTPGGDGPFELELEFLLETGPSVSAEASARIARQLEDCVGAVEHLIHRMQTG